jgi:hypothetical protein
LGCCGGLATIGYFVKDREHDDAPRKQQPKFVFEPEGGGAKITAPEKKISVLPTKSVWQGIIEPGSIPVEFSLEIEGDRVTGIAERKGADGGFLKAKFDGTFDGKTLHFEETDIIANKAVKIRWITIKGKMELVLAPKMAFDGTWVGTENPKLAGRVYLEKK